MTPVPPPEYLGCLEQRKLPGEAARAQTSHLGSRGLRSGHLVCEETRLIHPSLLDPHS